ncbi:hypothetical protein HMPREF1548_02483 [Clostridium sp. KLE 1755]|nr:hypothetical protein HMPREF1548_02483 [Clostridium sp. KLE 1755]
MHGHRGPEFPNCKYGTGYMIIYICSLLYSIENYMTSIIFLAQTFFFTLKL